MALPADEATDGRTRRWRHERDARSRSRRPGRGRAAQAGRTAVVRVPVGARATASSNGLSLLVVDLPGRPLVSASLILSGGVRRSRPTRPGRRSSPARALTEGTERYDAIALTEASERLGASLHADAGWDALSVARRRPGAPAWGPPWSWSAEVLLRPTFPEHEVERLRDERLNDLLQAKADPRRRVEEAFIGTIYAPASPYHRPSGGTRETVEGLTAADLRRSLRAGLLDPARATLVVGGDLGGQDVLELAERLFGDWTGRAPARPPASPSSIPRPPTDGSSASSTGRVRSRPRSASATAACRGGSPTSTPCRS